MYRAGRNKEEKRVFEELRKKKNKMCFSSLLECVKPYIISNRLEHEASRLCIERELKKKKTRVAFIRFHFQRRERVFHFFFFLSASLWCPDVIVDQVYGYVLAGELAWRVAMFCWLYDANCKS
jgi:hypothetical protein